jgi:hypothetical protein
MRIKTSLLCWFPFLAGIACGQTAAIYSVRAAMREPVDIDYNSRLSVVIDPQSAVVLKKAMAKAGAMYVRAYPGFKSELKKIDGRYRDPRTRCVRYGYHFRAAVDVDSELTLIGQRANGNWLNESGGRYQTTHWVLVPDDGTHPQGYTWLHEDIVPDYFEGGVEIRVNAPLNPLTPSSSVYNYYVPVQTYRYYSPIITGSGSQRGPGETERIWPQRIDLNAGLMKVPYNEPLPDVPAGGTIHLKSGWLPPGLNLDAQGHGLKGTPTKEGAYSFTVSHIDSSRREKDVNYRVEVEDPSRYCIQRAGPPHTAPVSVPPEATDVEIARCAATTPIFWHSAADLAQFFGAPVE